MSQNYPNATTERDEAYRLIEAMEQQIDGYRVTADALRASLVTAEEMLRGCRARCERMRTMEGWPLDECAARQLGAEKERDAARGEAAGLLGALIEVREKAEGWHGSVEWEGLEYTGAVIEAVDAALALTTPEAVKIAAAEREKAELLDWAARNLDDLTISGSGAADDRWYEVCACDGACRAADGDLIAALKTARGKA